MKWYKDISSELNTSVGLLMIMIVYRISSQLKTSVGLLKIIIVYHISSELNISVGLLLIMIMYCKSSGLHTSVDLFHDYHPIHIDVCVSCTVGSWYIIWTLRVLFYRRYRGWLVYCMSNWSILYRFFATQTNCTQYNIMW